VWPAIQQAAGVRTVAVVCTSSSSGSLILVAGLVFIGKKAKKAYPLEEMVHALCCPSAYAVYRACYRTTKEESETKKENSGSVIWERPKVQAKKRTSSGGRGRKKKISFMGKRLDHTCSFMMAPGYWHLGKYLLAHSENELLLPFAIRFFG
jgi:hypothetical protein